MPMRLHAVAAEGLNLQRCLTARRLGRPVSQYYLGAYPETLFPTDDTAAGPACRWLA